MFESAREMCGSVKRGGGKNQRSLWWNDEVKTPVRKNEDAWKDVLAGSMKRQNKDVWELTKKV